MPRDHPTPPSARQSLMSRNRCTGYPYEGLQSGLGCSGRPPSTSLRPPGGRLNAQALRRRGGRFRSSPLAGNLTVPRHVREQPLDRGHSAGPYVGRGSTGEVDFEYGNWSPMSFTSERDSNRHQNRSCKHLKWLPLKTVPNRRITKLLRKTPSLGSDPRNRHFSRTAPL
jgi:hypothetical protein